MISTFVFGPMACSSCAGLIRKFFFSSPAITFGTPPDYWWPSDLWGYPQQKTIAPLWDLWGTNLNGTSVLARFEDLNDDGTDDRLVVEWSDVMHANDAWVSTSESPVTFQAILQLNTGDDIPAIGLGMSRQIQSHHLAY